MFSCEFCKIFRNTFFREQLWVIAPASRNIFLNWNPAQRSIHIFFARNTFNKELGSEDSLKKRIAKKLAMLKYQKMFRNNERSFKEQQFSLF